MGGGHGEGSGEWGLRRWGCWMGEPSQRGGHSLGDTLVGMVILFFIPLVVPRQFLPLAQQTGHTHGTWDWAHQRLLLPPPDPLSVMLPFKPQIIPAQGLPRPLCPLHSGPTQRSTFTSVSSHSLLPTGRLHRGPGSQGRSSPDLRQKPKQTNRKTLDGERRHSERGCHGNTESETKTVEQTP